MLKPGAMIMAFGGTRTYHRLTCSIEDAGFEIRDCIMWVYGSGFPKSHDISKAIDKKAGAKRKINLMPTKKGNLPEQAGDISLGATGMTDTSLPITKEAQLWQGYGTALKPAYEPIILAMKPLEGTFAENALKWGVAGLWIDGGRVDTEGDTTNERDCTRIMGAGVPDSRGAGIQEGFKYNSQGRFPANLIHDGSQQVLDLFPETKSGKGGDGSATSIFNQASAQEHKIGHNDSGSAARFFYCAKASKNERNKGCEGLPLGEPPASARSKPAEGRTAPLGKPRNNFHPCVKPLKLMEYLCTISRTPPGGIVMDPFLGSGTTALAAVNSGRQYIGIERDAEYCEIARKRIEHASKKLRMIA